MVPHKKPDLSIVIPVFNEEENVTPLYYQLRTVLHTLAQRSEILFVDDGSKDQTVAHINTLVQQDPTVHLIRLRKHFGKADALSAGFSLAQGRVIITLDGDLQDDPQEIPRFIEKIHQGYDLVSGWKYHRKDSLSKILPSRIFNSFVRFVTGLRIHDCNCGYKAYRSEVTETLHIYGELHRYIPVLAHWNGFKVGEIKVTHHPRRHGTSKYGISRIFKGFIDLISVTYLTTYMEKPLHFFGIIGGFFFTIGFVLGTYLTYLWYLDITIWNRPLLLFATLLMILGVQTFFTGFIGEMIVNIHRKEHPTVEMKIKN